MVLNYVYHRVVSMTDIAKKVKNVEQDAEANFKLKKNHAEGKPSSRRLIKPR